MTSDNPTAGSDMPVIGNEIFERIKEIGRESFRDAVRTARRISDKTEVVGDGELLDAFFTLTSHLDMANPLLPVAHEVFTRYMLHLGIEETPGGVHRDWLTEDEWEGLELEDESEVTEDET